MNQPPATAGPPAGRKRSVPLKVWVLLALLFGAIAGLGMFTFAYAEGASYLSDDPKACRNCHIMNDVYDAWERGPHHAVATCNDCHIPHTFPDKYVVKALNGFNHSAAFTLQNFHEPIQITPFNKNVALNNCLYCHGDFVSQINHQGQANLEDCTRCHATIGHDEISAGKP
jgi:cytochrome c nitrite reductase small subunit